MVRIKRRHYARPPGERPGEGGYRPMMVIHLDKPPLFRTIQVSVEIDGEQVIEPTTLKERDAEITKIVPKGKAKITVNFKPIGLPKTKEMEVEARNETTIEGWTYKLSVRID